MKPPRSTLTGIAALMVVVGLMLGAAMHANGQTAPGLGVASSYAVLGGETVTNTGPTHIYGDVGVSPGSAITGFPPGVVVGETHAADAEAGDAQDAVTTAYNALAPAAQPCPPDHNLTGTDLGGGRTLTAGVYCFDSSAQLTGVLYLDAQYDPDAVFIFQIGSTLTTADGSPVSYSSVQMIHGGTVCNVFWRVVSSATIGTYTTFVGNILAYTSITLTTGANVSGRALARSGAVTMDTNNVGFSACAVPTATPSQTAVSSLTPTNTPRPTNTPARTRTPMPTNTAMPATTGTATPASPTSTSSPVPTATLVSIVTLIPWTPTPVPTQVPVMPALPTPTPVPTQVVIMPALPTPTSASTYVPRPPRSLPDTGTGGYLDAGE